MTVTQETSDNIPGPVLNQMSRIQASKKLAGRSAKELAQDDIVMATNSSSIVSKRSVEKIYYPNEPHFFRYFVKKFQRRSPLINRGYHLRLHVIDVAVRDFLRRPSNKTKVVVNLGCGRYPEACRGAKFVDIDFPDLLRKKCRIVQDTPELLNVLDEVTTPASGQVFLNSDQYIQIGCDLRELGKVEESLASVLDIPNCEFIFVAEVSITYMETEGADGVIKWASSLGNVEFCLLEQILPDGPDHPFAKTMLQHFNKLKAPPKSVFVYPTLQAQRDRFARLGWAQAEVKSLWQIWSAGDYLTAEDRKKLNNIEPFDEWEEFAMFAGHYCVVRARSSPAETTSHDLRAAKSSASLGEKLPTTFHQYVGTRGQRRFGSSLRISNTLGEPFISNIFGLGTNTRLRSQDIYGHQFSLEDVDVSSEGPPSRMCHGTADLGILGSILCGGRTSPSSALKDSWILSRDGKTWSKTGDLPIPLYRHGVARLGNSHNMAMVLGGKTDSTAISPGCFVYQPGLEWRECRIKGPSYAPVFGAVLLSFPQSYCGENGLGFSGIVLGGMLEDGTIAQQSLHWTLELPRDGTEPLISFAPLEASGTDALLKTINRFGAASVSYGCNEIALIGGIVDNELLTPDEEIIRITFTEDTSSSVPSTNILAPIRLTESYCEQMVPRPLLVGISATISDEGSLVIMGGGGVCFSMGSYWNEGCYVVDLTTSTALSTNNGTRSPQSWVLTKTQEITDGNSALSLQTQPSTREKAVIVEVPRISLNSSEDFLRILAGARPVIIENLSLGRCVQDWDLKSIVDKVGAERKVIVHEAKSTKMDFNAKNFSYTTKTFANFMQEAEDGRPVYLRALSDEKPSDQPANLETDFPGLATDFAIPDALQSVKNNLFSSVLRITGSANMWLHYDVMANIYCQIRGSKRLLLFPPADVTKLSFAPGASSSSIDVFEHIARDNSDHSRPATLATAHLSQTHPHEAILQPGEVLFLPALWPHTAQPLSATAGVAVNIFFRNLSDSTSYAAGRDVYGNRDLAAYEKGRQDVARIARAFDDKSVPADMKEFYILRLAEELLSKRSSSG